MKTLEKMIPYCGNCSHKTKKEGLANGEYYCDVLINTPMKGIVTSDVDGTNCVRQGYYKPIQKKYSKTMNDEADNSEK